MAFLNAKELKKLRSVPLAEKLTYIFAVKPYSDNSGMANLGNTEDEGLEKMQDDLNGLVIDWDATPISPNIPAIEEKLIEMNISGTISPTDIRKIKNLLYAN